MVVFMVVFALATSVLGVSSVETRQCAAPLPKGVSVPEPVVFRNSCGGFRLDRDGRLTRLPADWFASWSGGTGRRYGADLRIVRNRPGRIVLRRAGRVVWRSSRLYQNDAGSIAFGPHAFAFAAYRRGIFQTDLRGPERLVVRGVGLYPIAFLRDGSLLVVEPGRDASVHVVSPEGSVLRRHRYRSRNGYAFDERTESLYFVTPEHVLVRMDGAAARAVRPLRGLDGWLSFAGPHLTLSDSAHRGLSDDLRFTVLQRDGRLVSRWGWRGPKHARIDYGPVASRTGRAIMFRTATEGPPRRPKVVVYMLRDGETRAAPVLRHRSRQLGCGVGASFDWHGGDVLYSSTDGPVAMIDTRSGSVRNLSTLAKSLPRRWRGERAFAYWLRDVVRR